MKKKILINGRFTSHHFAIRNVIFNLAKYLSCDEQYEVYIILNKDSDIDEFKKLNLKILTNPFRADNAILNHTYTIFILPFLLLLHRINVVIYPQICIYLLNPCKTILYLHDLIEYYIDNQSKKRMIFRKIAYPYICKHADVIMTVSENTKKDIIKFFNIPSSKIHVAYNGVNEDLSPVAKPKAKDYVLAKYGIKSYIFYIGYLSHPQKNLIYLIDEFANFLKFKPDLQLVFAGPKGKEADLILSRIKEKNIENNFFYLGKVDFGDLRYLYSACEVFCFPSIYEGFGMPVLEAMACGAPVITSNVSSLPEIMNDVTFLIDPSKSGDLANKLEIMFQDDRLQIGKCNLERSKLFSWQKHGDVLKSVI